MTAAAGILHDEFHSPEFTRSGGILEMVQIWVNLPAKHKMAEPRYQTLLDASIPAVDLPHAAGRVRVIAGAHAGATGPAGTFTPLNVWDVRIHAGHGASFELPDGHTAAIAVLRGSVTVNGATAHAAELVVLQRPGAEVRIDAGAAGDAVLLVLSGEPIDEPIVGYGPFVMNTRAEIETAMKDFQQGKFGRMPAADRSGRAGAMT
jgi:redox-sensitive bicupin YhaK (pirin superfamily)